MIPAPIVLQCCAGVCFAGCVWGMTRHFRRVGKPTPAMLIMALAAIVSGVLQLDALGTGPLWAPHAAMVCYALSAALFWWAVSVTRHKLAACGQGCVSGAVVRHGPYRSIRHPFYTSYNLMWLAGWVATGWWATAVSAIAMAALYDFFAREEERGFLTGGLAEEYREYRKAAGRYWPRLQYLTSPIRSIRF